MTTSPAAPPESPVKEPLAIPGGQMLLATHSPFVVQQCGVESLLCFSRDEHGTHIISGPKHPALKDWDGTPDLGIVFAAGLLE